jgi:hypothetical protein
VSVGGLSPQEESRELAVEERRGGEWVGGALDPLLRALTSQYVDDADLSLRLRGLYDVRARLAATDGGCARDDG